MSLKRKEKQNRNKQKNESDYQRIIKKHLTKFPFCRIFVVYFKEFPIKSPYNETLTV